MLYFDTSFIAPLFIQEANSKMVFSTISAITGFELAISQWTKVEFSSLLARRVRMNEIKKSDAHTIINEFEKIMIDSFVILVPSSSDFDLAQTYLNRYDTALRSGDALHLAIAKNHGAKDFYTFDKTLIQAAKTLKISTKSGTKIT